MNIEKQFKVKDFDVGGLLCVIVFIGKSYKLPLPEGFEKLDFCAVCLGANYPGHKNSAEDTWCCGNACEDSVPPWGICERFKLDSKKLERLAEKIRPNGGDAGRSYGHFDETLLELCEKHMTEEIV